MTVKDKLEIGLKDDAPYRKDNLPPRQQGADVPDKKPGDPTRSPEVPGARRAADASAQRVTRKSKSASTTRTTKPGGRPTTRRS